MLYDRIVNPYMVIYPAPPHSCIVMASCGLITSDVKSQLVKLLYLEFDKCYKIQILHSKKISIKKMIDRYLKSMILEPEPSYYGPLMTDPRVILFRLVLCGMVGHLEKKKLK